MRVTSANSHFNQVLFESYDSNGYRGLAFGGCLNWIKMRTLEHTLLIVRWGLTTLNY